MSLYRLLYRSDCALHGTSETVERQVAEIVDASVTANAAVGLSGCLFLASGVFIQVLEGPIEPLEATFERICGDRRHRTLRLLDFAAVEERMFADWSMVRTRPSVDLCHLFLAAQTTSFTRLDVTMAAAAATMMRGGLVLPCAAEPARASRSP